MDRLIQIAVSGGALVETKHGGFNGTGYVNSSANGNSILFTNVAGGGDATSLIICYSLGTSAAGTGNLIVIGVRWTITFEPTGAWSTWKDLATSINLYAASNTIQFTSSDGI